MDSDEEDDLNFTPIKKPKLIETIMGEVNEGSSDVSVGAFGNVEEQIQENNQEGNTDIEDDAEPEPVGGNVALNDESREVRLNQENGQEGNMDVGDAGEAEPGITRFSVVNERDDFDVNNQPLAEGEFIYEIQGGTIENEIEIEYEDVGYETTNIHASHFVL
ncbi:hypothetical protein ACFFRR_011680 [Megaselia abdita]